MTVAAGGLPASSTTARPADKGTSTTTKSRLVSALVAVTGMRRREAWAVLDQREARGETPDEIEAYLRATYRIDPTGVTAARNVDRERGW